MLFRVILTLIALALPFTAQAQNKGDDLILDINQAYRKGDSRRVASLLPQARGHALEPWAAYWDIRLRLDSASAQEIQDFLARYAGSYQEDRLRNDWLLQLGARRDWAAFAAEYPRYRMNDDKEVRCYALLVESLNTGQAPQALVDEVRRNWMGQREADDGCTTAAGRLIDLKKMPVDDAWRRARVAMEANRPRAVSKAVELVAPDSLPLLAEATASPSKFLTAKVIAVRKVRKEMMVLSLIKLATTDIDQAAFLLDNKWGTQLSAEERNWVWGVIGKQAAGKLMSAEALGYYARVARDNDLTDEMLAWKARAALRMGRWKDVQAAVQAMSPEGQQDSTWVYWKARALLAASPAPAPAPVASGAVAPAIAPARAEALAALQSIASTRGFYEQLAQEELGQRITAPAKPAPLTAEEKSAARLNPGLNRGLYAILIGLRSEGTREWNYTTNLHGKGGMGDRELLAAAEFACQREVWDRCINTSERTKAVIDADQRFPTPFRDAVVKRSAEIGLEAAYVYGLIRQESRFIMDARSGVGASGLMQVMPATARWTARKIGLNNFSIEQLNDQATNIAIGTAYLKLALDDFAGSQALAAAAYNAGPGRPRAWRNGPVIEAAIWAENVPFSETRDYVKKVLSNATNYAALLTGQPQSLKARLGTVGPRDAATPEPNKDLP
ncbi:MAG: lytic transglycosylase domain-containing protein [Comamonadaceae bacterium]|nr:MAG: lytic transglycosylase domain-containing protein [Comamonadaceae bacterium]